MQRLVEDLSVSETAEVLGLSPQTHTIAMESDALGSKVWFGPLGLLVQPGDTVRWGIRNIVHTVAAYHPENDGHALRILEGVNPSGFLRAAVRVGFRMPDTIHSQTIAGPLWHAVEFRQFL